MPAASQVGPSEKRGTGGGWGAPGWRAMPATGGANGMWRQHSGEGTYGVNARSPRGSLHSLQEGRNAGPPRPSLHQLGPRGREGSQTPSQMSAGVVGEAAVGWNAGRRLGREDGRGGERRGRGAKGMGRGAEPSDVRRGPRTDDEP